MSKGVRVRLVEGGVGFVMWFCLVLHTYVHTYEVIAHPRPTTDPTGKQAMALFGASRRAQGDSCFRGSFISWNRPLRTEYSGASLIGFRGGAISASTTV